MTLQSELMGFSRPHVKSPPDGDAVPTCKGNGIRRPTRAPSRVEMISYVMRFGVENTERLAEQIRTITAVARHYQNGGQS